MIETKTDEQLLGVGVVWEEVGVKRTNRWHEGNLCGDGVITLIDVVFA